MNECPICLRAIAQDAVTCPHCGNSVDIFRTGYFVRPDLSRRKTASIWIAAFVVLLLVGFGLFRGCASRDAGRPPVSSR